MAKTVRGSEIKGMDVMMVEGAKVVQADIAADNGVIQVIGWVIIQKM